MVAGSLLAYPEMETELGKTELTQNVTRLAVLWLDGKGFKPVETEVSLAASRGWVADVAGVISPTQTELINLKLLRHPPRYRFDKRDDAGYQKAHQQKHEAWFSELQKVSHAMTAHIEVKTSVADFRRDTKWFLKGSPTNLKYIAMPTGMIEQGKWPTGWGILLFSEQNIRCVRPSPLYEIPLKANFRTVLSIAVRRDHITRYERLRQLNRRIRLDENERKSLDRILNAITFLTDIAKGNTIEEAKAWSGLRCAFTPYLIERIAEFRKLVAGVDIPKQAN